MNWKSSSPIGVRVEIFFPTSSPSNHANGHCLLRGETATGGIALWLRVIPRVQMGLFYQRFLSNVSVPIQLQYGTQRKGLVAGGAFETPLPERQPV